MARLKADKEEEFAYYHCVSRVIERRFYFRKKQKEQFLKLMRAYEEFCGVRVLTYCILENHFHILLEVPKRPAPELLPGDGELVRLARNAGCFDWATLEQDLQRFRRESQHDQAEALRERFFRRMWDVSWFMRLLKQRFSQWFNASKSRKGHLWESRFRSVLIEGAGPALATIAAYIDLNPIRAGIVTDPKDYRWSGYGEAVAGGRLARAGLQQAWQALRNGKVGLKIAMAEYRSFLYESGQAVEPDEHGRGGRRGFTPEEIEEVIARYGQLTLAEALGCRVRYFCDGAALGSRAFVDRVFQSHRGCFGPNRKTGARRLKGIGTQDLFVARALRVRPLG